MKQIANKKHYVKKFIHAIKVHLQANFSAENAHLRWMKAVKANACDYPKVIWSEEFQHVFAHNVMD